MFPFQIHMVHYNTKYDNFKEAMVHPDGLAVLEAFLEVSPIAQPWARRGRSSAGGEWDWGGGGGGRVKHSFGDRQRCKCSWGERGQYQRAGQP